MLISVIIITNNSQLEINLALKSLLSSNKEESEIIVVDNASSDKTTQDIRKKFPSVRLFINKKNLGFAKAANLASQKAKGEFLLFLNPDTQVFRETISEIIKYIQTKQKFGAIGGQVLNIDGSIQPSCGCFPTLLNVLADRLPVINQLFLTELIRQKKYYQSEQSPDWLSGVFFLTPKKLFQKLHGFDEQYFLYIEDVDYCYRLRLLNYLIFYYPGAKIIHLDQGKTFSKKRLKAYQIRLGLTVFFTKFKTSFYCFLWKIILNFERFWQ